MNIYCIGGSPCSGKSTIASALSERYGLHYFKVDDHLERYIQMGAQDGKKSCLRVKQMTPEQIWMREAQVQREEELRIYEEIFAYILADLGKIDYPDGIITEGAAFLPCLVKKLDLPADRYIALTPTKEFQLFHYRQREWVPYVLEGCSDQTRAFENWMDRDALFAIAVQKQCAEMGYVSLINNGDVPAAQLIDRVSTHFGLA